MLRRLAVHAGGCTLRAAEEVCAGGDVRPAQVAGVLARLVDRSLVVAAPAGGRVRYRMLESVAAYGLERLREAGEEPATRLRHARHHAALAESAAPGLRGPDQREWLRRLDEEAPNLRAALDHAVRLGAGDLAIGLVNGLAWYWFLRGRPREAHRGLTAALAVPGADAAGRRAAEVWRAGMAILAGDADRPPGEDEAALALAERDGDPAGLAQARWFLGFARFGSGDPAVSVARLTGALAGFRALGDRWGTAAALVVRARQVIAGGDLATGRRLSEESRALFTRLGDGWGLLQANRTLGLLAEIEGGYVRAEALHRDGLRVAEELGLPADAGELLARIGRIAMLTGDHERARDLHERALRRAAEQSHEPGRQFAEVGLGMIARRGGDLDEAERRLLAWLAWCRELEGDPGAALILAELGFTAEQRGDARRALALHTEGLHSARAAGDPRAVALALEGLAGAHSLAGAHLRAARLLGTAAAARTAAGAPLPPGERGDVDRITARSRAALGDARFEAEYAAGRPDAMSWRA
ncbi:ATP-binding protein [Spongiactinospora sp. 9N601]|uniref:ATP-binding protein n=1 Tax=Spongiactinospora sp. 9N601 TaxID=3375149 RepID=UPI0037A92D9B